jgi:chromosome segregation ATPase
MDRRKFLPIYEKTKFTANAFTDFINKEYVKSKTLEKTFQHLTELQTLQNQLADATAEKTKLQNERLALENEMAELEQQYTQQKGKTALEQLDHLDAETDALNNELKQTLRHLQKPFLKMQALATSGGGGGITPDELKMIGLYMDNPFEAIISEPYGYPTLKQILEKTSSLMAEDKLKLKPDKQRKAEQAVEDMLKSDSLVKLHGRSVQVAASKNQLLASAEMEEAKRNLTQLQQKLEALKARRSNIETDELLKENQRQELQEKTRNLKKTIESNVQSSTGKQVQIQ